MKNVKRTVCCLFFLFAPCALLAQELDIRWSKPFPYRNKCRPIQILHVEGEEVYLLCGKLNGDFKDFRLEVYDKTTLAQLRSVPFLHVFPHSAELSFDRVSVYHGAAYFFLHDRQFLYCSKYYFVSQTASIDAKRVTILPVPPKPLSESDTHSSVFFSEEGEHIVAYYNLPNDKNQYERIRYALLDTNLKQVDQRLLHLPYKDKHYQDDKYWVNAKGDLSLLGIKQTEKEETLTPLLYRYTRQSEEAHEANLPFPQGYLVNFHFMCEKGELRYQGLRVANGRVFFYRFQYNEDRQKLISTLSVDLTAPDLAFQYPHVYGDDLDLREYELLHVKQVTEDTLLVFLEQQTFSALEPKGYYFEDMIVFKATTKGDLVWITKISKRQALIRTYMRKGLHSLEAISSGSGLLSASVLLGKERAYLLYNDHKANVTAFQTEDLHSLRFQQDAAIFLTKLNEQGQWERMIIYDSPAESYCISHTGEYALSEKERISLAFNNKRKEFKLLKVGVE